MYLDRCVTYVPGLYRRLSNVRCTCQRSFGSSLHSHLCVPLQVNLGVSLQRSISSGEHLQVESSRVGIVRLVSATI